MKRTWLAVISIAAIMVLYSAGDLSAQMSGGMRMGPSANGHCPYCGQQWDGHFQDGLTIPKTLPKPKNSEWLHKLKEVLSREKLSKAQYETDRETYAVPMPYMMIIPQEDNHIVWISKLFAAYGLSANVSALPVKKSGSLEQAYKIAMQLENDLIPRYEWLITNAEDRDSARILNTILLQTRMHYVMFQHALQMGGGMGHGWGMGGMGPGMMH